MQFQQTRFVKSAPSLNECPPASLPEICFAGRSNVGKSSFINALINRKNLARTSNVPGKTQLINYYNVDDKIYFVDLPGYGFAKVPESVRKQWGEDMRTYLMERESLKLILHLVDARHKPTQLDEDFIYWMAVNKKPFSIILSKSDKLSHNKQMQSKARIKRILKEMNIEVPIILASAETKKGIEETQKLINEFSQT